MTIARVTWVAAPSAALCGPPPYAAFPSQNAAIACSTLTGDWPMTSALLEK